MSFVSRALDTLRTFRAKGYNSPPSQYTNYLNPSNGFGPHEPFAGAWQQNLDNARGAGPNILAFSGVYTCLNIVSSDIARLPLRVLRRGPKGNREPHPNHPAQRVLNKPNSFQTQLQFMQQWLLSKLTQGNTYTLILRDDRGVPNELLVLDPNSVQPLVATDGSIFYRIGQDILNGIESPITVRAADIIHDRCSPMFHPLIGTSPLFSAAVSAMTGSRILMNSETFFANMSRTSGVLVTPGKVDPELAKQMQARWEQNYSSKGLGRIAVLSNGFEYKPMTINAADAELIDQLRWTIEDVARCFRVPGFKLGDLNRVTFKNSETMAREYYQGCLSYHIKAIEQLLDDAFKVSTDVQIEFDLDELFRTETDTRYDAYQSALTAGFMSINEVRMKEDLAPVKGGEEPRVQAQYLPLSKADGTGVHVPGATPAAPSPAPKPAPSADDEPDDDNAKGMQQRSLVDHSTQYTLDLEGAVEAFKSKLNGAANGT